MSLHLSGGGLSASAIGNGWDVRCPKCGQLTHVPYRVASAEGAPTDFIAAGGMLTHFECPNQEAPNPDEDGEPVACGFVADNIQMSSE